MASLLQLSAVGVQDTFLTSNPTTSFFTSAYHRHTPFSIEMREVSFSGATRLGARSVVEIPRVGDLVRRVFLKINTTKTGATKMPAEQMVKDVELFIGGQTIDKVPGTFFRVFDEAFRLADRKGSYMLIADCEHESVGSHVEMYLPLTFWFSNCDNAATALPLIQLAYHNVEIAVNWNESAPLGISNDFQATLMVEYIYLSAAERAKMAAAESTHIIYQIQRITQPIQFSTTRQLQTTVNLPFNHPVTSLFIVCTKDPVQAQGEFTASNRLVESMEVYGPLADIKLILNGMELQPARSGHYYRSMSNFLAAGRTPSVGVYAIHFCLQYTSLFGSVTQSTGHSNFSRIDNARLVVNTKRIVEGGTPSTITKPLQETVPSAADLKNIEIYAVNINFLKFKNGLCGLLFSS